MASSCHTPRPASGNMAQSASPQCNTALRLATIDRQLRGQTAKDYLRPPPAQKNRFPCMRRGHADPGLQAVAGRGAGFFRLTLVDFGLGRALTERLTLGEYRFFVNLAEQIQKDMQRQTL